MLDEIRGDKSRHLAGIDGGKTDDYNRFGGSVRDRDSRDAGQFRSSSSYYNSPPVAKRAAPSPLISAKTPVKQTAQQQQPQQRQPQQSPLPKRTEPLSSFGYSERSFIAEKLKKVAKDLFYFLFNFCGKKILGLEHILEHRIRAAQTCLLEPLS